MNNALRGLMEKTHKPQISLLWSIYLVFRLGIEKGLWSDSGNMEIDHVQHNHHGKRNICDRPNL